MACSSVKLPLAVGDTTYRHHTITEGMINEYGNLVQDWNAIHYGEARIAHGTMLVGFISAILGMQMPGPGTILIGMNTSFVSPARPGDTLTVKIRVADIRKTSKGDKAVVKLATEIAQYGDKSKVVVIGSATCLVPLERVRLPEPSTEGE